MQNLLFFLFIFLSCQRAETAKAGNLPHNGEPTATFILPYDLDHPDKSFAMPAYLQEISGLSLSPSPLKLCAIQDESGSLYFINKETGVVDPPVFFKQTGDFEGVEFVGTTAWAQSSKGILYEIKNPGTEAQTTQDYPTALTKTNNVEGLCYDAKNNRLLLACKGQKELDYSKPVYAFDLATKQLSANPVFSISQEQIQNYLKTVSDDKSTEKLQEQYGATTIEFPFGPSGIAIHPKTGDIYMISSVGKVLVVLSETGEIKYMQKLHKETYQQPEGITFDMDGTLYISNEGKTGPAMLYRLNQKQ